MRANIEFIMSMTIYKCKGPFVDRCQHFWIAENTKGFKFSSGGEVVMWCRKATEFAERAESLQEFLLFAFHSAASEQFQGMPAAEVALEPAYAVNVCGQLQFMDYPLALGAGTALTNDGEWRRTPYHVRKSSPCRATLTSRIRTNQNV